MLCQLSQRKEELMETAKPFKISKQLVFKSYQLVKANKGSAGIDGQSLEKLEKNLKDNLYKIWNRMSSGTYFPPAVREVKIPKGDGKQRSLGIPTVADRIAQMVVVQTIQPRIDAMFHENSYGYRPNKSAIDAVGCARERCWYKDWVIDLDIKGFFDNIDHRLLMKAVDKHVPEKWIRLYIERWLKAPVLKQNGTQETREKGTPQGGVVSPLLANLFLHYAFDVWMRRDTQIQFERYADDIIVHCRTQKEAETLKKQITERFEECKLELHPGKTKIIYCKDDDRKGNYMHTKFDFLGYTFRQRQIRTRKGKFKLRFNPSVSNKSKKKLREKLRNLKVKRMTNQTLTEVAKKINPIVTGWINYFSAFRAFEAQVVLKYANNIIRKWARVKYKKLQSKKRLISWIRTVYRRDSKLFIHWKWVLAIDWMAG